MATDAEIANDMQAHASYWARRDADIERTCRSAERVIRAFLAGEKVDGRTYFGVHMSLLNRERRSSVQGYPDFGRARNCIERLRAQAVTS